MRYRYARLLATWSGRAERHELLGLVSPEDAADALEEMRPDQLEELLRESDPAEAAALLAKMEPDEAAEALWDRCS